MAVLSKFLDNEVTVLDELSIAAPKTKDMVGLLAALGLSEASCLLAIDGHDVNVWKSARNIPTLAVSPESDLNAYDLLRQKRLLVTKGALDKIRGRTKPAA
jgi:large subunit ribosomal protein L4